MLVIGLSIPLDSNLSIPKPVDSTLQLVEYVSPTLHMQQDTYVEKQYKEILEKIFIDRLKEDLD